MKVSPKAGPVWQRFYTGNYDYNIKDLHVDSNNLITVLIDAQPFMKESEKPKANEKGHLRLLTLSPRGEVLYKDSFKGGDNAFATKLLRGDNTEHVIMAMKQYKPPEEMKDMDPINEGWLIFSPSFVDYRDPCLPPEET